MIFLYEPEAAHFVIAKLRKGTEAASLNRIQTLYESFNPGYVFKPQFIDQDYQALYASEEMNTPLLTQSTLSTYPPPQLLNSVSPINSWRFCYKFAAHSPDLKTK